MLKLAHYHTQEVRDLAYSCFGPSLAIDSPSRQSIEPCHLQLNQHRLAWLEQLDTNPAPLLEKITSLHSRRLGLYFEALWQFFIDQDPVLELLAANLPVTNQERTLGEFDIIYYCNERRNVYHLELAVKFYLGLANVDNSLPSHWWGPNCKDRLDRKLHRLFHHQCPLSSSIEGINTLRQLDCKQPLQEFALKGMLFYPASSDRKPRGVSSSHQRGRWLSLENISACRTEDHWKILQRCHWLSPYLQTSSLPTLNQQQLIEQLEAYFQGQERPLMICSLDSDGAVFYEKERYFITPDDWPPKNTIGD